MAIWILVLNSVVSFRSVRNFIIDLRQYVVHFISFVYTVTIGPYRIPAQRFGTGLHWQVSQATSLFNIVVHMSTAPDTAHQGNIHAVC